MLTFYVPGTRNLFNTSLLYAYVVTFTVSSADVDEARLHRHLETDSEAHESLNSRFLLANISFVGEQPTNPTFTIYGAV